MIGFELYVFFLCLIVFIGLTALFTFMICYITKQKVKLIESGLEDKEIKESITKKLNKSSTRFGKICDAVNKFFSLAIFAVLCVIFVFTTVSSCMGDSSVKSIPAIKVIASTSMSEKYEKNTYLFDNDLNDQLNLFDLVILHQLPPEEELKLYDIVVYEHISGALLIHRIVGIEEPNESHPSERHFLLQGDAVHYPDSFPVRYSQMKSIYRGERIPNVGSFVYFIQSPAGIICAILALLSIIIMPIADNYLSKKEFKRVLIMVEKGEIDKKALVFYKKEGQEFLEENTDGRENQGGDE